MKYLKNRFVQFVCLVSSINPLFYLISSIDIKLYNIKFENNINRLKPTGYVMHQQFNIQQLYALPTLYLCVLYLSENKQRLVPLRA
jgi:hypothetical protein